VSDLKTWRQFLPLSLRRLSSISMISTKSVLRTCRRMVEEETGSSGARGQPRREAQEVKRRANALVVGHLGDLGHPARASMVVQSQRQRLFGSTSRSERGREGEAH